jgi:hypothetical protein
VFLLEFAAWVAPGSGLMFFIFRFVRAKAQVSDARLSAARAGARVEGARRAALVAEKGMVAAQGQAQEALAQTGEALAIAKGIGQVSLQVQGLTEYLVDRIDRAQPSHRGAGRHALPGPGDQAAIVSGRDQVEGTWS